MTAPRTAGTQLRAGGRKRREKKKKTKISLTEKGSGKICTGDVWAKSRFIKVLKVLVRKIRFWVCFVRESTSLKMMETFLELRLCVAFAIIGHHGVHSVILVTCCI